MVPARHKETWGPQRARECWHRSWSVSGYRYQLASFPERSIIPRFCTTALSHWFCTNIYTFWECLRVQLWGYSTDNCLTHQSRLFWSFSFSIFIFYFLCNYFCSQFMLSEYISCIPFPESCSFKGGSGLFTCSKAASLNMLLGSRPGSWVVSWIGGFPLFLAVACWPLAAEWGLFPNQALGKTE